MAVKRGTDAGIALASLPNPQPIVRAKRGREHPMTSSSNSRRRRTPFIRANYLKISAHFMIPRSQLVLLRHERGHCVRWVRHGHRKVCREAQLGMS